MITVRQVVYDSLSEVVIPKQEENHRFNTGDIVTWESNRTIKTGEVVAIVPPFEVVPPIDEMAGFSFSHLGYGVVRRIESYVVAIPMQKRCKVRQCYWPLTSQLRKV